MMPNPLPSTAERLEAFARLLDPPDFDYRDRIAALGDVLTSCDHPAAAAMAQLGDALALLDPEEIQELHLQTFDLAPACIPYLSVHLFGEESFRRSQLMVGLHEAYERIGHETHGELPDHLGVVLDALDRLTAEEAIDLHRFALAPALLKMRTALEKTGNPYRYLIKSIELTLVADFGPVEREESTP
jgi:nitrate reductase molybdenum cofactor assembly chaperone